MRYLILLLFLPIYFNSYGQDKDDDNIRYEAAIDWLESKLNYVYYDEVGEKWWTNTFYINDQREVTIKHVASKNPNTANIKSKTYTIRTFKLKDINPYSLEITKIEKSKGRLVKGKMLELRTFNYEELIHKKINNRKGSSTSFLYLSFPTILNDSISNYAELVKEKFHEAIIASTRLYPDEVTLSKEAVFKFIGGDFISEEGTKWTAQEIIPNVLKIESRQSQINYLGFDTQKNSFYFLTIESDGYIAQSLMVNKEGSICLKSGSKNLFTFFSENSFEFMGIKYFRE